MMDFLIIINEKYGENLTSYSDLHQWSIKNISTFWEEIWRYCGIQYSVNFSNVIDDDSRMPGAKWFKDSRLNFAENLLKYRDNRTAISFKSENGLKRKITYKELFNLLYDANLHNQECEIFYRMTIFMSYLQTFFSTTQPVKLAVHDSKVKHNNI